MSPRPEMAAWEPAEAPRDAFRFWRGVLAGIPAGVLLWTAILLWIWS